VNYYELMVILSPTLTEEQEKEQHHQIEELLKSQKAEIHLVDFWGKRKLSYALKKQRQGVYNLYFFEVEPGRVSEIDRKLKMAEQVLRFLMFRMEKIQILNLKKELVRRSEAASAPPPPEPAAAEVVPEPAAAEVAPEPAAAEVAPETAPEAPAEAVVETAPETPSEA
jgi:small subunit ribosomal protein S6